MWKKALVVLVPLLLASGLGACKSGGGDGGQLIVYSGRNENLVKPILERFAKETGIDIKVKYGETAELAATLLEEGKATEADVFFSQDAGALAALAMRGRLASIEKSSLDLVPERFRDPKGRWVGVTGRARVFAYNTEAVPEADLPQSVFELVEPKWKDRVGAPPTNASFVAFVSALIEQEGRDKTKTFLEALKANGLKTYDNNVVTLEAVADGEIDLGLVNHYYLYNEFKQRPGSPVANFYPGQGADGEGTFVNVAGLGVLKGTDQSANARKLVAFLLGEEAQEFFREETSEYPLRAGVEPLPELPALDSLKVIDVPLSELGKDLEASLDLLQEVGLT